MPSNRVHSKPLIVLVEINASNGSFKKSASVRI